MKSIMRTEDFNRLITATKSFCAKPETKTIHMWIRLEFSESTTTAVALDGYKMSIERAGCIDLDEKFVAYVKPNMKKFPNNKLITIERTGGRLYLTCGEDIVGFQQPDNDSDFLDWQKAYGEIIEKAVAHKIAFNAGYLQSALQSIKATTPDLLRMPLVVELRSPVDPIILRSWGNGERIVLPVRMRGE